MSNYNKRDDNRTPIVLLKARAADDGYQHRLGIAKNGLDYRPIYLPVLDYYFDEKNLGVVRELLESKQFGNDDRQSYGGLIFTSQRAVEAFAHLIREGKGPEDWPYLYDVPIYVVGPATSRALRAIPLDQPLNILGPHTGDGEKLADFIVDNYDEQLLQAQNRYPLLFLTGKKHRDIIPQRLASSGIGVTELTVYGTCVTESFEAEFQKILQETSNSAIRWVVLFSISGGEAMLRGLDLLDPQTGRAKPELLRMRTTYIATIGPTTRDSLRENFGFDPDVCCQTPDPEGLERGIKDFLSRKL